MTTEAMLAQRFVTRYPREAARVLQHLERSDAGDVLMAAPVPAAAVMLTHAGPDVAAAAIGSLPTEVVNERLAACGQETAAAILTRLGPDVRDRYLAAAPVAVAADLRRFLGYPEDSAGRLMDQHALIFRHDARAADVVRVMRETARREDQVVLVMGEDQQLLGVLPIAAVFLAEAHLSLAALMPAHTPAVEAFAHRDEVAELLGAHRVDWVPVIDRAGRPLGILRQGALASVAASDATADMQSMVGASRDERALSPVGFAVRKRLPWLQINLATAFLAAAVVGFFEDTIARFSVLAVLLPVVAGQSGNTGAQSLAVMIRGLTLREISLRHWFQVMRKESSVGFVNGVAVSLVTMAGVFVWSGSPGLCLVIGVAMVLSMTIAAVAGAGVPLLLDLAGQDPAQSSSIILTTVTDIVGFLSFLGLATMLSSLLPV